MTDGVLRPRHVAECMTPPPRTLHIQHIKNGSTNIISCSPNGQRHIEHFNDITVGVATQKPACTRIIRIILWCLFLEAVSLLQHTPTAPPVNNSSVVGLNQRGLAAARPSTRSAGAHGAQRRSSDEAAQRHPTGLICEVSSSVFRVSMRSGQQLNVNLCF